MLREQARLRVLPFSYALPSIVQRQGQGRALRVKPRAPGRGLEARLSRFFRWLSPDIKKSYPAILEGLPCCPQAPA